MSGQGQAVEDITTSRRSAAEIAARRQLFRRTHPNTVTRLALYPPQDIAEATADEATILRAINQVIRETRRATVPPHNPRWFPRASQYEDPRLRILLDESVPHGVVIDRYNAYISRIPGVRRERKAAGAHSARAIKARTDKRVKAKAKLKAKGKGAKCSPHIPKRDRSPSPSPPPQLQRVRA